jgi:two-component system sensor histidine kinase BaeS
MRVTITAKIALAVIGIAILCITTLAWVTSQNLKNGFIAYLNEQQAQELEGIGKLMLEEYRQYGSLEHLRHNRDAVKQVLDRRPPSQGLAGMQVQGSLPPPPQMDPGMPPPPPPGPERRPIDPLAFGQRLSMLDQDDRPLFGPPNPPLGSRYVLMDEGKKIGTLQLAPLVQVSNASDAGFLRNQLRAIFGWSAFLILAASLVALVLSRQLLRPLARLRSATQKISQGKLATRVKVEGRDELAELAGHVNALAQSLQENEQHRRRVLADVSHELRTPLSVIRGEIEALLDGIRSADRVALKSLHSEALRLNQLVEDLYLLALADAGDLHYRFEQTEFAGEIDTLLPPFVQRAQTAGLQLQWHNDGEMRLQADAGRLRQLLTNLLENSLRYTDAGGMIQIHLSADRERLMLCVEDSAPGVPADAYPKLFERLYRVDLARSREHGGSGLGLSICQAIVHAHRGTIEAMPSRLGGLKVLVSLPLQQVASRVVRV